MKKSILKLFFPLLIIFSVAASFSSPVFASLDATDTEVSFFINIYDEEQNEFFLPNIEITVPAGTTVSKSMDILKEKKLISDFKRNSNMITSISFLDGTTISVSPPPDTRFIYVKHNGKPELTYESDNVIEDGDILEWIYGRPSKTTGNEETNSGQSEGRVAPIAWEDEHQQALSAGCEFLELNKETQTSYLVAMGVANKTLDTKMINNLLSRIRKTTEYETPKNLANSILSLTFSGYDASELVQELSKYVATSGITVEDAIYTLLAYDCNRYYVSTVEVNSRDNIIRKILSSQDYDGKFKGVRATANITTTAMALAAIAPYSHREEVQAAIDKAVEFLANAQNENGMFRENGIESAFTLSKVIIGLVSANISVEDERFVKNEKNLLQLLLEYQKTDGGFSDTMEKNSTVLVTEQSIIALATIKKNSYPYYVNQTLIKMKTQESAQIIPELEELSPKTFSLGIIAIIIAMVAVIISYIKKYNPNNSKIF